MYKKIIAATIFLLYFYPSIVNATMEDALNSNLSRSLAHMEELYASGKWDEAMEIGRGIIKDAPKDHKAAYRAQDLIVLSLEGKNQEILQNKKRENNRQREDAAQKMIVEGNKLFKDNNYKSAAEKYISALKITSGDAQTYFQLGYSQLKIGHERQAYESLNKCLQLNSKHARALFHIAGLSFKFNKSEEAEEYTSKLIVLLEKSLEENKRIFQSQQSGSLKGQSVDTAAKITSIKKNLAQAAILNGMLLQKRKNYKDAAKSYLKASKIKTDDPDLWFRLGICYLNSSTFHQAAISFEQAISLRESKLKLLVIESKRLINEGLTDKAIEVELKQRNIRDELANTLYMLALTNNKKNDPKAALTTIEKSLEIKPDFWQGRYTKAVLLASNNRFDEALDEMREVLKESKPNSNEAKKAVSMITTLMDKIARRDNPVEVKVEEIAQNNVVYVEKNVKDMPGIGGKDLEVTLEDVFPKLREISELVKAKNYAEASRRLIYLRGKHPEIADIHAVLGSCYNEMGRLNEAESCYKKTIEIQPNHAEALNGLANIWAGKGANLDKALEYAEKAIKEDSMRPEYFHTHGLVLFKKGELRKSIESYKKALGIRPNYMLARYDLGLAFYLVQGYQAAIESFDAVLALNPTHQKALLFKSICLAKINEPEMAIENLKYLKETLEPKSALAKVVKDFEQKIIDARDRNEAIPVPEVKTTVNIDRLLAEARDLKSKNLVTSAKEKYLECQRLAPTRYEPYNELGQMYADSGLNKAALSAWEKAAELAPKNYDIFMNIGKMQHKVGQIDKAKNTFETASKIKPKDSEPLYYIGLIAYEDKNFETAVVYAKDALKLKSNYFKAMALLGMSQVRLDRLVEAKATYEKLYAKAPVGSSIKQHARIKIWEINKGLKPEMYPSYDNAIAVKKELEDKAGIGEKTENDTIVIASPKISFTPSEEELIAEYGKNTMTPNDKELVLNTFEKLGQVKKHTLSEALQGKTVANSKESQWFKNKMQRFETSKKYGLPSEVKNDERSVMNIEETYVRVPDRSDQMTKMAIESMAKGFVIQAADEFKKAVEISPHNIDVLLNNGFFNTLQGNFKDAFDAYAEATVSHPENNLARLGLGNLYWLGGQADKAIEQWQMIKGKYHNNEEFSATSKAEMVWKRMLEIDPLDVDAHANLGLVYMFSGDPTKAIVEFEAVGNLERNHYEQDYYRAQMHMLLYTLNKNRIHKKEAESLLEKITKNSQSFPHSAELRKYVAKL